MVKEGPTNPLEGTTSYEKFCSFFLNLLDKPATLVREKIVEPNNSANRQYYYHRRFRRVPTIDECHTDDDVCWFEANEQFRRDKKVDESVLTILRNRRMECEVYWGHDAPKKCEKVKQDYLVSAGHFFEKYGDLGPTVNVTQAYLKQKHRMVWERRHGKVGSGMKKDPNQLVD